MKSKDLSLVAIFASLYTAMVIVFSPVSFYALQFRIAGIIRPAIAKKPVLAIGYALGVVVANLFSPFAGFHELIFMPFMSLVAGLTGYFIAEKFHSSYFVAGIIIATIIPVSVSWMLNQLFEAPMALTFPGIFASEQIINGLGSILFRAIESRYKWWD